MAAAFFQVPALPKYVVLDRTGNVDVEFVMGLSQLDAAALNAPLKVMERADHAEHEVIAEIGLSLRKQLERDLSLNYD